MDLTIFDFVGYWLLFCAVSYLVAVVGMTITDWISWLLGWL